MVLKGFLCLASIRLAVFAIGLADFDVSSVALLRFVRVTGVHLLQVHRVVVDEEPDAGSALDRRFVLPTLMDLVPARDGAELAAQRIVSSGS